MYSSANALDQRTLESIKEQLGVIAPVFTPIPRATAIAVASEYGMPLGLSSKKQRSTLDIFDEISIALEAL